MMRTQFITQISTILCLMAIAATASTDVPDTHNSTATAANCGRFTVSPCGNDHLDGDPADIPRDYTVTVVVLTSAGDPIVGLDTTDMWLWHNDLATCPTIFCEADAPSNAEGEATFSGPIRSGLLGDASDGVDCDETHLFAYALGVILNSGNPVCVSTDSPDLNGDGSVGVADFGKYAADYNCIPPDCDPCHDYDETGNNNVADFAIFSSYFNSCECP